MATSLNPDVIFTGRDERVRVLPQERTDYGTTNMELNENAKKSETYEHVPLATPPQQVTMIYKKDEGRAEKPQEPSFSMTDTDACVGSSPYYDLKVEKEEGGYDLSQDKNSVCQQRVVDQGFHETVQASVDSIRAISTYEYASLATPKDQVANITKKNGGMVEKSKEPSVSIPAVVTDTDAFMCLSPVHDLRFEKKEEGGYVPSQDKNSVCQQRMVDQGFDETVQESVDSIRATSTYENASMATTNEQAANVNKKDRVMIEKSKETSVSIPPSVTDTNTYMRSSSEDDLKVEKKEEGVYFPSQDINSVLQHKALVDHGLGETPQESKLSFKDEDASNSTAQEQSVKVENKDEGVRVPSKNQTIYSSVVPVEKPKVDLKGSSHAFIEKDEPFATSKEQAAEVNKKDEGGPTLDQDPDTHSSVYLVEKAKIESIVSPPVASTQEVAAIITPPAHHIKVDKEDIEIPASTVDTNRLLQTQLLEKHVIQEKSNAAPLIPTNEQAATTILPTQDVIVNSSPSAPPVNDEVAITFPQIEGDRNTPVCFGLPQAQVISQAPIQPNYHMEQSHGGMMPLPVGHSQTRIPNQ
ncbi:hypothetical protein HDU67_002277, partial [Dinochytrium kinnereticum]